MLRGKCERVNQGHLIDGIAYSGDDSDDDLDSDLDTVEIDGIDLA